MDNSIEEQGRRVEDVIRQVTAVTQEVADYLKGGSRGMDPRYQGSRRNHLLKKQLEAMKALSDAMAGQQEVMQSGDLIPQRRATDPVRIKPKLSTVEDVEIAEIQRLAGIITEDGTPPERVFMMIEALARGAMESGRPFQAAQQIIALAQKVQG
jgi:hypothetical protein